MNVKWLRKTYIIIATYLTITLFIGLGIVLLPLNRIECDIVLTFQTLAHKTFGIGFFQVLTYLGDFYLWTVFSVTFFFYTYFISRKRLRTSIDLVLYLILVTASTYILKEVFARPRPNCTEIVVYYQEASFSYPSGHVSRGTGAFITLLRKGNVTQTFLSVLVTFFLSSSRIVLGTHFLTDVFGGVFLALAIYVITEKISNSFFQSV